METVFRNPQSILCGIIAGLLFIPTTIFDMVWGVRYLQEARGFDYGTAVMRSAMVPFGWIIGCPLLGFMSDRIGRRKPVIVGGALVLFACLGLDSLRARRRVPPYVLGTRRGHRVWRGDAAVHGDQGSQSADRERHRDRRRQLHQLHVQRAARPGLRRAADVRAAAGRRTMTLEHYQTAFVPMLYGVALAIVLTLILKETGPAAGRPAVPVAVREAT